MVVIARTPSTVATDFRSHPQDFTAAVSVFAGTPPEKPFFLRSENVVTYAVLSVGSQWEHGQFCSSAASAPAFGGARMVGSICECEDVGHEVFVCAPV